MASRSRSTASSWTRSPRRRSRSSLTTPFSTSARATATRRGRCSESVSVRLKAADGRINTVRGVGSDAGMGGGDGGHRRWSRPPSPASRNTVERVGPNRRRSRRNREVAVRGFARSRIEGNASAPLSFGPRLRAAGGRVNRVCSVGQRRSERDLESEVQHGRWITTGLGAEVLKALGRAAADG